MITSATTVQKNKERKAPLGERLYSWLSKHPNKYKEIAFKEIQTEFGNVDSSYLSIAMSGLITKGALDRVAKGRFRLLEGYKPGIADLEPEVARAMVQDHLQANGSPVVQSDRPWSIKDTRALVSTEYRGYQQQHLQSILSRMERSKLFVAQDVALMKELVADVLKPLESGVAGVAMRGV